jgi:hypothetical protein
MLFYLASGKTLVVEAFGSVPFGLLRPGHVPPFWAIILSFCSLLTFSVLTFFLFLSLFLFLLVSFPCFEPLHSLLVVTLFAHSCYFPITVFGRDTYFLSLALISLTS